jgi:hypothetical protein
VLSILGVVGAIGINPTNAVIAQTPSAQTPSAGDVMLTAADIGNGFTLVDESTGSGGLFTRTFRRDDANLIISAFAVTTPPGIREVFSATPAFAGFDLIDEPSLELARWMAPTGTRPGDGGISFLNVGTHDFFFSLNLGVSAGSTLDGPGLVKALARRQIELAGAPDPLDPAAPPRAVNDAELLQYLPAAPPPGYGLTGDKVTFSGANEMKDNGLTQSNVERFLTDRSKNVAAAWGGNGLTLAAGITEYPYALFAASSLGSYAGSAPAPIAPERLAAIPDAVVFHSADRSQVGVVFRRGHFLVTVLVAHTGAATEDVATSLGVDTADLIAAQLPAGATSAYTFPPPVSKLTGIALTTAIVLAAVGGSRIVARLRARRVRRSWAETEPAQWIAEPAAAGAALTTGDVVVLDDDATHLRHRGEVVAGVQLATIVVGVVALSGDFGVRGVIVATVSLVVGLSFTRWWLRREQGLLGPTAPPRAFHVPRLAGALIGIGAFAVLGIGLAYFLKGLRYIIFKPTLALIKWSEFFGWAPRTVGIVFTLFGLVMVGFGAVLWRIARAFGRARVAGVLRADSRPPVLYLRSFGDDALPLPIIASARRPLFEFFSIRGADPFEECVAWELDSYGPVIAVGRPGGSLASLGAAREHLPNTAWHEQVAERMHEAGVIVLAPGDTAGLTWELQQIVERGHLRKTIFVFPPLAPGKLVQRWEHTAEVLRAAGAEVGTLPAPPALVHTVQIIEAAEIRATCAARRDEATYRTAVDRALEAPVFSRGDLNSAAPEPSRQGSVVQSQDGIEQALHQ